MRMGAMVVAALAVTAQAWGAEGLEPRLAGAEDRAAIEKLVTGDYPRALDQRLWKEYSALFTADGALTMRDRTLTGPQEIERFFVSFRSPSASGPPPGPGEIRTLHIVDVLKKQDGQWRFAKRVIVSDLAPPPAPGSR
jgi:hypothetical protein